MLSPTGGVTKDLVTSLTLLWLIQLPVSNYVLSLSHQAERFSGWQSFCFSVSIATFYRLFALFLQYSEPLICCSLCDMKEEAGAKVKRENNLQGDRSFSDLQKYFLCFCDFFVHFIICIYWSLCSLQGWPCLDMSSFHDYQIVTSLVPTVDVTDN